MTDRELNTGLLWIVGTLGVYFWGAALLFSFGWPEDALGVGLGLTMLALLNLLPLSLLAIWQWRASGFGLLAASVIGTCGTLLSLKSFSIGTSIFNCCLFLFVGWIGLRLAMPANEARREVSR